MGGSLDEKRKAVAEQALQDFDWETVRTSNLPKWNGLEQECYSNKIFAVDSPEKFAYALRHMGDENNSDSTINILTDLDMNGQNDQMFTDQAIAENVTINGNGHTIYNFYSNQSMIKCSGAIIEKLNISRTLKLSEVN